MTATVKNVQKSGVQGLQFIARGIDIINNENKKSLKSHNKVLFEVQAENAAVRDHWLITINELLSYWEKNPDIKPIYNDTAAKTSDKITYFKKKEEELNERIKINEERRNKYAAGGMNHVAQAMMNRS